MNCQQVEELLPLYAGRDLEEKRAALVTEHLQTCAACACVADDYRKSVQLTQQFATPIFSEAVYADLRQRVLGKIEAEANAPVWSQTIVSLFRPRLTWAIASVLLIVVSIFATYLIVNNKTDEKQLAVKPSTERQPEVKERSNSGSQHDTRPNPSGEKKQQLAGVHQPRRKRSLNTKTDRIKAVASKSAEIIAPSNNVSLQSNNVSEPLGFPHPSSAALVKTLRVEIQTKDPKIKIIWFVQPETKPVIPGSKGT